MTSLRRCAGCLCSARTRPARSAQVSWPRAISAETSRGSNGHYTAHRSEIGAGLSAGRYDDSDNVADVLAQLLTDLRVQRHHVGACARDHGADVLESDPI